MARTLFLGAVIAIIGAFPLAAVTALLFGFPVPFAGKMSGPEALVPSQIAVVVYGLIGGFPFLAAGGAVAGAIAVCVGGPDRRKVVLLCAIFSALFSAAAVFLLAILDWIIGPW